VAAVPDYPVSIDSGYHVSLGRWYGEHGSAFWDHINFGPGGRPNLQGPALHVAIGLLGRLLGGSGDAYVLANAVLAVLQWAAVMFTAAFFARRLGGDAGALFAVALLSGNTLAAGSFAVGIPSGWLFVLTPWAIHFFLEDRPWLAALATAGSIYVHLGGYAMAPVGLMMAALLTRRWRSLVIVGTATVLLTAPYTIHLLRHREWYRGAHGHVALGLAPLIYLAALPGVWTVLRRPRRHVFLLAWLAAPAAWIVQDYTRFLAQATLPMAAAGGVWLAQVFERLQPRARPVAAAALVALATLPSPLNDASLRRELAWVRGFRYPRPLDWGEARTLAAVMEEAGLTTRLVSAYNPTQCIRLAVYAPMLFEKGHWVEVQPPQDPAEDLPAGGKVYVLPLAPDDAVLTALRERGLLMVHGGSEASSVVTLASAAAPDVVAPVVGPLLAREAAWLSAHARNNVPLPAGARLADWKEALGAQRASAGRLQIATIVYAQALEATVPDAARGLRGAGRGFGSMANFLGDDTAIGFVSEARHARLRENMAALATAAAGLGTPEAVPPLRAAFRKLFGDYFSAA
jgi:hypothetical protein